MGWKNLIPASVSFTLVMLSMAAKAVEFAGNISPQTAQMLSGDLDLLSRLQWGRDTSEILHVFKVNDVNARTMQQWLDQRVHYILDQNHALNGSTIVPLNPVSQANVDNRYRINNQVNQYVAAAVNIGTNLYVSSLQTGMKLAFDIKGVGLVSVKSPRVGIIQILPPFLMPLSQSGDFSDPMDFVNRVYRLSTLFHEGRHSDGHREHLGFAHSVCPKNHSYEGISACDSSSNGAYRISALFIESVLKGCEVCTYGEKEALRVIQADYMDRIVAPESHPTAVQRLCKIQSQLGGMLSHECQEQLVKQSLEWDDSPEAW